MPIYRCFNNFTIVCNCINIDNRCRKCCRKFYISNLNIHTMASIRYSLKSSNSNSSVYMRFAISRKQQFERSTGVKIPSPKKDWSGLIDDGKNKALTKGKRKSRGKCMPKQNSEVNKQLHNKLSKLSKFILQEYNLDYSDSSIEKSKINSNWLKEKIESFFNRTKPLELEYFLNFGRLYHTEMNTYIKNGIKKKYSQGTIDKFKYLLNHIQDFEDFNSCKLKISEIGTKVAFELNDYFVEEKEHSTNTRGINFNKFKTILLAAESKGLKMNPDFKKIKGFSDDRIITTLSFDEIDKIKETKLLDEKLLLARDWLIIGCSTGQRISDLHRMNKNMIVSIEGNRFIKLTQFKTNQQVHIPITNDLEEILKKHQGNFPPVFYQNPKSNRAMSSKLMKEVCRKSGITEIVKGRLNGVNGDYPKYKLISNHSCRRSFASNRYGTPFFTTPQLMEITGHITEKSFLLYIGESENKFSQQNAKSAKLMEAFLAEQRLKNTSNLKLA